MTSAVSVRFDYREDSEDSMDRGVSPAGLLRQEAFFREDRIQNMPMITLWKDSPDQLLGDSRQVRAVVREVFGAGEDAAAYNVLGGWFPLRGDRAGAMISRGLAKYLWGSASVLGKTITWDNRSFNVSGILDKEEPMMLVQADVQSTALFPNMLLRFPEGGGREEAERFLNMADFSHAVLLDLPLLGFVLRFGAYLPALFISLLVLGKVLGRAFRLLRFPALLTVYALPGLAAAAACGLIILGAERIPPGFIPTAWSDFEFYRSLFTGISSNVSAWLSEPSAGDIALLAQVLAAAGMILLSITFITAAQGQIRIRSLRGLVTGCFLSYGVMLFMSFALAGRGGIAISPGMWLAPCIWAASEYGFYLFDRFLAEPPLKADNPKECEEPAHVVEDIILWQTAQENQGSLRAK